jgi:GDPmannose 4,6-dehydratase
MKSALIVGAAGQDGSYLAELLLTKGYLVHGIVRPQSGSPASRLESEVIKKSVVDGSFKLYAVDLADDPALSRILVESKAAEIYHLAGQSSVAGSRLEPVRTCDVSGLGVLRLMDLIDRLGVSARFFHASSSEIFGRPNSMPQDEYFQHMPVNPYGCAKSFATHTVRVYRESKDKYAVNGILYNHESPRRGAEFVTRKITRSAAAIKLGFQTELLVGDITSQRDWGYAPDYVEGMWRSLQVTTPGDYVFATGVLHSVGDVLNIAFGVLGLDWRQHVKTDPAFLRPNDPNRLMGNASKAADVLDWRPTVSFAQMIREMTLYDMDLLNSKGGGYG